jgi:hypothetical protein
MSIGDHTLAGLVAAGLLAGAALGACGDDEEAATTVGAAQTVSATTPATTTVTLATPSTQRTGTVEGQVEQTATVVPVVTFAGQRAESLGDIDVQARSVLRWSCPQTCERFAVTSADSDDPRLDIEDAGESGKATVSRGSYTSVRVRADSAWTLSLEAEGD